MRTVILPQVLVAGILLSVALPGPAQQTGSNAQLQAERWRVENELQSMSSNFPRFDRNLNTGGRNYDETVGLVAHNVVHHSRQQPSQVTPTVVRPPRAVPVSTRPAKTGTDRGREAAAGNGCAA